MASTTSYLREFGASPPMLSDAAEFALVLQALANLITEGSTPGKNLNDMSLLLRPRRSGRLMSKSYREVRLVTMEVSMHRIVARIPWSATPQQANDGFDCSEPFQPPYRHLFPLLCPIICPIIGSSPDTSTTHGPTIEPHRPGAPRATPTFVWIAQMSTPSRFCIRRRAPASRRSLAMPGARPR